MTLFTLDIKKNLYKTSFIYLLITILCITINYVYAKFSHGVSSNNMKYMFLFPLLGGTFLYFILGFFKRIPNPKRIEYNLYNSSIATFIVGNLIKGVLEIAGTTTPFQLIYWVLGSSLLIVSIVKYFML